MNAYYEMAMRRMLDAGIEHKVAARHRKMLGDKLRNVLDDAVSEYLTEELPQYESDAKEAAEDAYWEHKIDEAREGDVD